MIRSRRMWVFFFLSISFNCAAQVPDDWAAQQGRRMPLQDLIPLLCGYELKDWDERQAAIFERVAQTVCSQVRSRPIRAERINEVGNAVELLVLHALAADGLNAGRPVPLSGRKKTAGYPDLYVEQGNEFFYLEIKTYSPKTLKSSQRTFYISPSDDFKVSRDAYHLLLAFSTEEIRDGVYSLTGFKLLDLYGLECRLKLEFNASNKDLYDPRSGLIVVEE